MFTLLSGIFGGLLRLAPELIKYFNMKAEQAHELNMQKMAYDFQVLKGKQEVDMIVEKGAAEYATKGLDALKAAIDAQAKPSGIRWIDGFSALMRPLITFQWVILLYPGIIIATFVIQLQQGVAIMAALLQSFGPEEKALVAFIVDFWFVGRVLDVGRKKYGGT
jgi:hypothetical protein